MAELTTSVIFLESLMKAEKKGVEISDPDARKHVYGMPYSEWKANHQTEASAEKQEAFKVAFAENVGELKE